MHEDCRLARRETGYVTKHWQGAQRQTEHFQLFCIKIEERALQAQTRPSRLKTKDAVDVRRLLVAVDTGDLVAGLRTHAADEFAAPVSERALRFLSAQRSGTQHVLADLVDRQLGNPRMVASYEALTDDLLAAVAEADLTV